MSASSGAEVRQASGKRPVIRIVPSPREIGELLSGGIDWSKETLSPLPLESNPIRGPTRPYDSVADQIRLSNLKRILRHGCVESNGRKIMPFIFRGPNGAQLPSGAPGWEAFVDTERRFVREYGEAASVAMLEPHYFNYAMALLSGVSGTRKAIEQISEIRELKIEPQEKYRRFVDFARHYTSELRQEISQLESRNDLRTYQLFIRACDLAQMRASFGEKPRPLTGQFLKDFDDQDFQRLKALSFDSIRPLGLFKIGTKNAKGDAGGSPFAIQSYTIDPAIGTEDDMREFCARAKRNGILVLADFICNHTSADSEMLELDPRLYIHTLKRPDNMEGWFEYSSPEHGTMWIRQGGYRHDAKCRREYWTDTLQLDLSNALARDAMVAHAIYLAQLGIHGLRVDMAYKLLNVRLKENWGNELRYRLPEDEFLARLITKVRTVAPDTVFIAEAFDQFDALSECGFDLVYGLNDMPREGGHIHHGMYDALASKEPGRIREALRRAEFLSWQRGGAASLHFWGQHDKEAPWRTFGDWKWGASVLTLLMPGTALSLYAGVEAEYEAPCKSDQKMITFESEVRINWDGIRSDFGKHQIHLLEGYRKLRDCWGEVEFHTLSPTVSKERWVGYVVQPKGANPLDDRKIIVLANPTDKATPVRIRRPDLNLDLKLALPKCGPNGFRIVEILAG